jgi:hypothetical protein
MNLHIEHIESDNGPVPYWHVQHIIFTEAALTAARGMAPNLGLELVVPLRLVRSRIRYEDLARQPFTPVPPDVHHRNETLIGMSDPRFGAHFGTVLGGWSLGARAGATIPVGRTEPNPFELGRLGLPHEHIQFGTGTWDPVLSVVVARSFGRVQVEAGAYTRLSLYENAHGYRAGNLYNGSLAISRHIAGPWGGFLGTNLTREEAERWSGRLEEEGNLGRHDVTLSVGVGRPVAGVGSFAFTTTLPIHSEAHGEQADAPVVFSLGWSYP